MKLNLLFVATTAVASVAFIAPRQALAWDDQGHSTVGEIAERNLTAKGKAFVFEIVGAEPLAVSATFPDHVRSDIRYGDRTEGHGFDFAPYHFFEIPYGKTAEQMRPRDRAKKDADVIISDSPEMLAGRSSRDQKMILFRYLVHVVGDVHQPLHVGNGRDRGANWCKVWWEQPGIVARGKKPRTYDANLHSVWDGKVDDYIAYDWKRANGFFKWFGYKEMADLILSEHQTAPAGTKAEIDRLKGLPIATWYNESQTLHQQVYPNEQDGMKTPEQRQYCDLVNVENGQKIVRVRKQTIEGVDHYFGADGKEVPTLTQAYFQGAKVIVKKQMLLAGLRLAKVINDMAERANPRAGANADINLLRSVLLLNEQGHGDHAHEQTGPVSPQQN